ncbi:hypothetical protein THRCLA_04802 [Thraustotheca clavata]|uniref:Uncharacterized protein n=1 Tax=Thraustotheca clavata TaxID=74557 RepID=A0A1V9ZXW1_9STRA|nr:hypothetical protein THRCLA_04802 [Thraustotheca clavata]
MLEQGKQERYEVPIPGVITSVDLLVSAANEAVLVGFPSATHLGLHGKAKELPFLPFTAGMSDEGTFVAGWLNPNCLSVYYEGNPFLSRVLEVPSTPWRTIVLHNRIVSASLFEIVLLVVCVKGDVLHIRIQNTVETIVRLANLTQWHPNLTSVTLDKESGIFVVAGGVRSSSPHMSLASSLSIWKLNLEKEPTAELQHFTTVLDDEASMSKLESDTDSTPGLWSTAKAFLGLPTEAEAVTPGQITQLAVSPNGTFVALLDRKGRISLRQIDTSAAIVPWTLADDKSSLGLCWLNYHLIVAFGDGHIVEYPFDTDSTSLIANSSYKIEKADHGSVAACANGFYFISIGEGLQVTPFLELPIDVVYRYRIKDHRFEEALALAKENDMLDIDEAHKAAALATPDVDTRIHKHLTHIKDISWVQHTVATTLEDSAKSCARLWKFGLSLDKSFVVLQRLLDMLETFLLLVNTETTSRFDPSSLDELVMNESLEPFFHPTILETFMDSTMLETATALARDGRVIALTIIMERYGFELLPYRLDILCELPLALDPTEYAHLLPCLVEDSAKTYYSYDKGVPAPSRLRDIPGFTVDDPEWFQSQDSLEVQRDSLCAWFSQRAIDMETQLGQLEAAKTLLDISADCVNLKEDADASSAIEQYVDLHRQITQFYHFVYDCDIDVPLEWTINQWIHLSVNEKLSQLLTYDSHNVALCLQYQLFTENQLCKFLQELDMNNLDNFRWAASLLKASCPKNSDRIIQNTILFIESALVACLGFDLAAKEQQSTFVELAWSIFESLPAHAPDNDIALQELHTQVDELQMWMDGMERCAAYGLYYSPQTLQLRQNDEAFATEIFQHFSLCANDLKVALDDAKQMCNLVFHCFKEEDAVGIALGTLLKESIDLPESLEMLIPSSPATTAILLKSAKFHMERATAATSPCLSAARTILSWIKDASDDKDELLQLMDAATYVETWSHVSCPPMDLMKKSINDRVEMLQMILTTYPDSSAAHHIVDVSKWLKLHEHIIQLQTWAVYSLLQCHEFTAAISMTRDMLDSESVLVYQLVLDVISCSACLDWSARCNLAADALLRVSDGTLFSIILGWQKKLTAMCQAASLLDLSLEDRKGFSKEHHINECEWLREQLVVYAEIVSPPVAAYQVMYQLEAAFSDAQVGSSDTLLLLAKASLATVLFDDEDAVALTLCYISNLPLETTYDLWLESFNSCADDNARQLNIARLAHDALEGTQYADEFATLQVSSTQAANVDKVVALLPKLRRDEFNSNEKYRYESLCEMIMVDINALTDAITILQEYKMDMWNLNDRFIRAMLLSKAPRELELKKAQLYLPLEPKLTVLEFALTKPSKLVDSLLNTTYDLVASTDIIGLEFIWRVVSLAWQQDPTVDVSIDRVKLFIASAKEIRKMGVSIDFKAFTGFHIDEKEQASAALLTVLPILTGQNIRLLANMLRKVHGIPTSNVVLIYLDLVLSRSKHDIALAYESCAPFASGLSNAHAIEFLHLLLNPARSFLMLGYTFTSSKLIAPNVSPRKRVEMVEDTYALVAGRPLSKDKQDVVAFLEIQAVWITILALLDEWKISTASYGFPYSKATILPEDLWLNKQLSLAQCHILLQLLHRLPIGPKVDAVWLHSIDISLASPAEDFDDYCKVKWSDIPVNSAWVKRVRLPCFKSIELDAFNKTEHSWLMHVQDHVKDINIDPSQRQQALKSLTKYVPSLKLQNTTIGTVEAAVSILAKLHKIAPNTPWADHENTAIEEFGSLFNYALKVLPDTLEATKALAEVLLLYQSYKNIISEVTWEKEKEMTIRNVISSEQNLENITEELEVTPLWQSLWQRNSWSLQMLIDIVQNDGAAYASWCEQDIVHLISILPQSQLTLGLLSRFKNQHEAILNELLSNKLVPSSLLEQQLILLRYPSREWTQLPLLLQDIVQWNQALDIREELWFTSSLLYILYGLLERKDYIAASRTMGNFSNLHPLLHGDLNAGMHLLQNYIRNFNEIPPHWASHWPSVVEKIKDALP